MNFYHDLFFFYGKSRKQNNLVLFYSNRCGNESRFRLWFCSLIVFAYLLCMAALDLGMRWCTQFALGARRKAKNQTRQWRRKAFKSNDLLKRNMVVFNCQSKNLNHSKISLFSPCWILVGSQVIFSHRGTGRHCFVAFGINPESNFCVF